MYQIKCDSYTLYDHRDEDLVVLNPKCKLEVNTVGEGSFTVLSDHPYYGALKKLRSIFEIRQDNDPIFRGRMTADSRDFHNQYYVDLEGVLAFTNDSIVDPFNFPADFPEATDADNIVEYFLKWLIEDVHNGQVEDWQKLKVGTVTVTDPNNYITRSSEKHLHTWNILKSKLFESELGGYLCIRYEDDGNYVDYLSSFPLTNTQPIRLGENLLDMQNDSDASETYSAILPIGKDGLTLAGLEDGDLTDDLVKKGKFIYSKSAVEAYGWICVPVENSTWDDVTEVANLKTKGMNYLTGTGMLLSNTITVKAVDLHFSDDQIQSFRIYRNILVDSPVHGVSGVSYPLTKLDIDLMNPQNTVITVGATSRTLIDINADRENNVDILIQSTKNELKEYVSNTTHDLEQKIEGIDGTYFYIKYSAYVDGHVMTDVPDDSTKYMGTCSTNQATAPTDYTLYTWVKVGGEDGSPGQPGKDGKTQYLHIKYSDDGKTFTGNLIPTDISGWKSGWYQSAESTDEKRIYYPKMIPVTPGTTYDYSLGNANFRIGISRYTAEDDATFTKSFTYNVPVSVSTSADTNFVRIFISPVDTSAEVTFETYQTLFASGALKPSMTEKGVAPGEILGSWIGTLVDFNEADSEVFSDYTWKKFTEDVDIDVGGRNLLQKSNPADWLDDWLGWGTNTAATMENGWLHVVRGGEDASYGYFPPKISTFPAGKLLLSFDAYSDTATELNYNYIMAEGGNSRIGKTAITAEPTRHVIPISLDAAIENCSIMIGSTLGDSFFIRDIKVEMGNVPTAWTPAPEDTGAAIGSATESLHQTILEQSTSVLNNAEAIIMSALERYVETSDYEEFRQTVASELEIMADQISMNFSTTTEQITNVNGDLQAVVENLTKHFEFSVDGLVIRGGENSMNLLLDNDLIRFMKNGQQFGWWDGVDFHTGNIVVEVNERAQFGNFAFVPRSNGSLSFLKVGG